MGALDAAAAGSSDALPVPVAEWLGSVPPEAPSEPVLAVIEVVDRDGQARQSLLVRRWPASIGRALDNDLVLGDAHVAAHHAEVVATDAGGLDLVIGETRNGAVLGRRRLPRGARASLAPAGDAPLELTLGRTLLRLRLAGQRVADEVALAPETPLARRALPVVGAGLLVVGGALFTTYLAADPDAFVRTAGMALLSAVAGAGVWCGAWALLSKTFAHRARFGWHLRVFLFAGVAMLAVSSLPKLLAFMFSWPWLSDFDFVGPIAVIAAAFYFHLLAVEPNRRRWLKGAAVACGLVGVLLSMWFNEQRVDQLGDELYMSHLFPPALRFARTKPVDGLIDGLATLKDPLDKKAREPGHGNEGAGSDNEE